jgi:hypothetical protein
VYRPQETVDEIYNSIYNSLNEEFQFKFASAVRKPSRKEPGCRVLKFLIS